MNKSTRINTCDNSVYMAKALSIRSHNGTLEISTNGGMAAHNSVVATSPSFEIFSVHFNQEKGQKSFHILQQIGSIAIEDIKECSNRDFQPNLFYNILLNNQELLCVCKQDKSGAKFLHHINTKKWHHEIGMQLNERQLLVCAAFLFDPDIPYVAMEGIAGTGKTMTALLAALHQLELFNTKYSNFHRIRVLRPLETVGPSPGTLPGDSNAKFEKWLPPIIHNLNFILQQWKYANRQTSEDLLNTYVSIESIAWLRGETFDNEIVIVDDAQNLNMSDVKTIITRLGVSSKIIFTGDPSQIDNDRLNITNNGFVHMIRKCAGLPCFGYIRLNKCERHKDIEAMLAAF